MDKTNKIVNNYLYDPDPQKVILRRVRKIKHDHLLKAFLAVFSFRDRTIARVLYYTNITLEKILRLKVGDIQKLAIPETLLLDLKILAEDRKEDSLIFLNFKGEKVQHTHIYQAFRRASEKTGVEISPTDLQEDIEDVFEEKERK